MSDLGAFFSPEVVAAIERAVDERVAAALAAVPGRGADRRWGRWLSVRGCAEYLSASDRVVYRRLGDGRIDPSATRHQGRRVLIAPLALDRQLEAGT